MLRCDRRHFIFPLIALTLLWQSTLLSAQESQILTLQEVERQVLAVHPLTQAA